MIAKFASILQKAAANGVSPELASCCSTSVHARSLNSCRLLSVASSGSPVAESSKAVESPGVCQVQVIVKSFELRYISEASTVIRDLMFLNIAPKSRNVVPTKQRWSSDQVNLVVPISDVHIPTRLSKYTVLRSPHVDKKSREQFEKRVHKRCITASTTSLQEVQSLIDSITSYDFTGVQLQINVTHNSYLQPAHKQVRYGEVLSDHRQANADLFHVGQLRYGSEDTTSTSANEHLQAQLESVVSTISDPDIRNRLVDVVNGVTKVLLDLKLGTRTGDEDIAQAVAKVMKKDGSIDPQALYAVVKYGLLRKKLSEMVRESDEGSVTAEELKGVFQAVAAKLLEPTTQQQQLSS